jgi:transposase
MRWSDMLRRKELNLRRGFLAPKTVRKWLRRWQPGSLRGLEDQSKAPKSKGSGIDPDQRQKAIELKRKLKSWGGLRIKREFNLSLSDKAIRSG